MDADRIVDRIVELADSVVRTTDPAMKWMWGPALLGYALTELDAYLGTDRYFGFTKAYCDHHVRRTPRVDQSDTCAPALVTYAMQKRTGDQGYGHLTSRVLDYIRNAPRVAGDAVNHLGSSPEGRLYPKSIWVDSLMMFAVFPARFAAENADARLLDFAARQPALYASYLQDRSEKLWHHAYWFTLRRPYPRSLFWGRGNGWVIASLPMLLDYLPEHHPERPAILRILGETSAALLPRQREDGWFETLLNLPGESRRESSCTALIASGWLHGVRSRYLDDTFRAPAERALAAVTENLKFRAGEVYMEEISAPTIPLPLFPRAGYALTPLGKNYSYGVAALILAAIEYGKLRQTPGK